MTNHSISLARRSLLLGTLGSATATWAQIGATLPQDTAERTEKLVAAANREGTLTIYTAFRPQDLTTVIAPFESRYGIKVKAWRSGSNNVMQRVLREAVSRRPEVDLIMVPASEMVALQREKTLQAVSSPHFRDMPSSALPGHQQWATVFMNVMVQVYNTQLVKKEDLPKTYLDLLEPRWKGNLGIEAKAEEWFAKVVLSMGEEKGLKLFRDIVAKNGMSTRLGASLLNNLVAAGEVPLALTVYIDLPEKDKRAGKPVDWFALDPVVAQGFNMAVAQKAPHPAAAQLFYDYMLSPETQKLLASLHYVPTNSKVRSPYPELRLDVVDPVFTIDNYAKWNKAFEDVVTKQAR